MIEQSASRSVQLVVSLTVRLVESKDGSTRRDRRNRVVQRLVVVNLSHTTFESPLLVSRTTSPATYGSNEFSRPVSSCRGPVEIPCEVLWIRPVQFGRIV
jgi:hypothetical protein